MVCGQRTEAVTQNNYMEGSGSATIKYRNPSRASRGKGNLSK